MEGVYAPATGLAQDERFQRTMLWSAGAHVLLAALLWFAPNPISILAPPTPVYIDVVIPSEAPPPAPAAKPKQRVDEIVIPKKPKPLPKPEVKAKPVPKPKPEKKPEKAAKKPAPSPEDLLNKLRRKVESRPGQGASAAASSNARAGIFDPEKAAYQKKLTNLLYGSWAGAGICRKDPKPSNFQMQVAPDGRVSSIVMTGSSGNRFCDESAERAIRKVNPFPRPPRGLKTVTVKFDPLEIP